MKSLLRIALGLVVIVTALSAVQLSVHAQDNPRRPVTDDEVNAVSKKLYCPVCENITLDTCGTLACAQWREEVRILLSEGKTPEQVIENFVARFGDRVVGTPVDPTLRALSLVTPWLLSTLVLLSAAAIFIRWRKESAAAPKASAAQPSVQVTTHTLEEYRARIEADLAARR
ncbi:MAG: cytochrome c-type biogenesis protein CcmH [Anaerolineae bacterium]|nr:cytochrome c-type biogenesis protein CcmH [Anaerolineae bacterium]MDW8299166.1 cytochrome c-type biogenesis protein CcmH [Anaerolineae bacterium]